MTLAPINLSFLRNSTIATQIIITLTRKNSIATKMPDFKSLSAALIYSAINTMRLMTQKIRVFRKKVFMWYRYIGCYLCGIKLQYRNYFIIRLMFSCFVVGLGIMYFNRENGTLNLFLTIKTSGFLSSIVKVPNSLIWNS